MGTGRQQQRTTHDAAPGARGTDQTFSADAFRGVAHARLATMNKDAARTSARLPVLTFPSSHSEGGEARVRHNCNRCPKRPRHQRLGVNSVQPPPLTVRTTMAAAAARHVAPGALRAAKAASALSSAAPGVHFSVGKLDNILSLSSAVLSTAKPLPNDI